MHASELRVRGLIRCAHLFHGPVEQLAIMIAPDVQIIRAHECIGDGGGLQRAGEMVAQINDQIGRLCAKVRLHGFEGAQIPVNIGEHGDPHNQE